ncbi:MAG: hypothetical protein HQK98_00865 [Nitrospirae bacterium]|nr:hypothetical protein [Nitrospirota bacterium]
MFVVVILSTIDGFCEIVIKGTFCDNGTNDSYTDATFCITPVGEISDKYKHNVTEDGRYCIPLPEFDYYGKGRNAIKWYYNTKRIGVDYDWWHWLPNGGHELNRECGPLRCGVEIVHTKKDTKVYITNKTPSAELSDMYKEEYLKWVEQEMNKHWELSSYDWDDKDVDIVGRYPKGEGRAFGFGNKGGDFIVSNINKPYKSQDYYMISFPYYKDRVRWFLNGKELAVEFEVYYVPKSIYQIDDECQRDGQECKIRVVKKGKKVDVFITTKRKVDEKCFWYVD